LGQVTAKSKKVDFLLHPNGEANLLLLTRYFDGKRFFTSFLYNLKKFQVDQITRSVLIFGFIWIQWWRLYFDSVFLWSV